MFFKWLVLGKGGVDDVAREPADSSDNAVSVAMAHWNVQHRVFAVERFTQYAISCFSKVDWLPRSPDLLICDFFSVGIPQVLSLHEQTSHDRKDENFPFAMKSQLYRKKMLERAIQDFEERIRMFVRQEGFHLTDITFST